MKENPSVAPNTVTYNSLIDICVRCFDIPRAQQLFEQMQSGFAQARPDLITYSTMIKGFCKDQNIEAALTALNTMETYGIKADEVLYNSLLDGCCKVNEIDMAFKVYQNMQLQQIKPSNVTFSILIKLYSKMKDLTKALQLLD